MVLVTTVAYGQSGSDILPQALSPNASEIARYGKVPVSFFNGLPDITIPLTELRAKNYSLPIYLTYYAGGNKPEIHPGWVGQGWTLHAGGCINRVVNTLKDEMNWNEYVATYYPTSGGQNISSLEFDPGYFYRAQSVQSTDWTTENNLISAMEQYYGQYVDYSPDEFQVNIDDIHASFYFVGGNEIRIVSRGADDFTAEYHINTDERLLANENGTLILYEDLNENKRLRVRLFDYIDQIILTKSDGTKYYFGGDLSSIEFSAVKTIASDSNHWVGIGSANSWMLTKIERPDGEKVLFSYTHDGVPIVRQDCHQFEKIDLAFGGTQYPVNTFLPGYGNISYLFTYPCYLTSIQSVVGNDEILFTLETSNELSDPMRSDEFAAKNGQTAQGIGETGWFTCSELWSWNYYKRLKKMTMVSRGEVSFTYENTSSERLRLGSVTINGYNGTGAHSYQMEYNSTRLPAYGSKLTDSWGYYNGQLYGQSLQDTLNINYNKSQIDGLLMQAEMLTRITYPTGGSSEFEYEPHQYQKIAEQYPFELISSSGQAGGLRIKKITDHEASGDIVRSYTYSGGILSGIPRFRVDGVATSSRQVIYWWRPWNRDTIIEQNPYEIYRETPLYQLSTTLGSHVTYSVVRETFGDGSYTEYKYSNHDTTGDSYIDRQPHAILQNTDDRFLFDEYESMELKRGNLLQRTDYKSDGKIVRDEENTYQYDTTAFIETISRSIRCGGLLNRVSYIRKYSFFPKLTERAVKTYSDEGTNNYQTESYTYEYDSHRNLTRTTRTVAGVTESTDMTYSGHYSTPVFTALKSNKIFSWPVETVRKKDGQVVETVLNEYRINRVNNHLPLRSVYSRTYPDGISTSEFQSYEGILGPSSPFYSQIPDVEITLRDSLDNPLSAALKDGSELGYSWSHDGMYLEMVSNGASDDYRTETVSYESETVLMKWLSRTSLIQEFDLTLGVPQQVTFTLLGAANQNWVMWIDLGVESGYVIKRNWSSGPTSPEWNLYSLAYTDTYSPYLPAGTYHVCIQGVLVSLEDDNDDNRSDVQIDYLRTVSGDALVGSQDIFHESFETEGNQTSGWNGTKGHAGSYSVSLPHRDETRSYIIDYRLKVGNSAWTYVRSTFTGSINIGSEGVVIDEVRIYPADSEVTSYTYDYNRGLLLSETDTKGLTTSYEYDSLGRLSCIKDNSGNVVRQYTYHYHETE